MLNSLPDKRNVDDMSEVFLAPNEEIDSEIKDDTEIEQKLSTHGTFDLNARRKSSINLSKSTSSSSIEISQRRTTVNLGKFFLEKLGKNNFIDFINS